MVSRKRSLGIGLILIILALVIAGCGGGGQPVGYIAGYVYRPSDVTSSRGITVNPSMSSNVPLSGATVTISGPEHKVTTTDSNGYFLISAIPGVYSVAIEHSNYTGFSVGSVTVRSGQTTQLDDTNDTRVGANYIIIVGVGNYPTNYFTDAYRAGDLNGPAYDVNNMERVLKTTNKLAVKTFILTDLAATKDNIQRTVSEVTHSVGPMDNIIFYFSGHGVNGSSYNGEDESIVPYDGLSTSGTLVSDKAITDDELEAWFKDSPTQDILFIFDNCYSGGMTKSVITPPTTQSIKRINPLGMAKDLNQVGYTVLMASDKTELSYDMGANTGGLFTKYLVDGIDSHQADVNNNREITPSEAFYYARDKVTAVESTQHPQMFIGNQAFDVPMYRY